MASSSDEPTPQPWGFACPRCRYDTRGLRSERCPECGITLADAVTLSKALARAGGASSEIAAALLATLTSAGCAFIATALVADSYRHGFRNDVHRARAILLLAICGGGIAIGCINWLRARRPRPPVHFGWTLAVIFALLLLVGP